ncbi:hypothetical protein CgunFtcFv8_027648 [Champsocephalus gunnari]|uniref:Uncharacterized protein n=1 Tax=Champsocephalus gunnari TaxID=52237 RepID=A0AAN8EKN7_CHAGU|nr:hypothetical protein CgunFtcFv8_027648 [Champsocephalus gunnari]
MESTLIFHDPRKTQAFQSGRLMVMCVFVRALGVMPLLWISVGLNRCDLFQSNETQDRRNTLIEARRCKPAWTEGADVSQQYTE